MRNLSLFVRNALRLISELLTFCRTFLLLHTRYSCFTPYLRASDLPSHLVSLVGEYCFTCYLLCYCVERFAVTLCGQLPGFPVCKRITRNV